MFKFLIKSKKNNPFLVSPVKGEIIKANQIKDPVFSQEMMGPTIGFRPYDDTVVSPVNGVIEMVFPTKHAVGIRADSGESYLIHVGIDTVSLNGEGFNSFVKQNQHVSPGQKLIQFDHELLKSKKIDSTIMLIITDGENHLEKLKCGEVDLGETLIPSINLN